MIRRGGSERWVGSSGVWFEVIKKDLSEEVIKETKDHEESKVANLEDGYLGEKHFGKG